MSPTIRSAIKVSGLPLGTSHEQLRDFFTPSCGRICSIQVNWDSRPPGQSTATINFEEYSAAEGALRLDGTTFRQQQIHVEVLQNQGLIFDDRDKLDGIALIPINYDEVNGVPLIPARGRDVPGSGQLAYRRYVRDRPMQWRRFHADMDQRREEWNKEDYIERYYGEN